MRRHVRLRGLFAGAGAAIIFFLSAAPAAAHTVFHDGYGNCGQSIIGNGYVWGGGTYQANMRLYYRSDLQYPAIHEYYQVNPGWHDWDSGYSVKYRLSAYGYHAAYDVYPSCS